MKSRIATVDSPEMRRAGRDLLSLALIEARNFTLHLLAQFERALPFAAPPGSGAPSLRTPLWLAGHIGWFSERWIARNTLRSLGDECPSQPTLLGSIEPRADEWWNAASPRDRDGDQRASLVCTRSYLLETLECTLDLLEHAGDTDAGLYFFRLALFYEDLCGERLVEAAQALGVQVGVDPEPTRVARPALSIPATTWTLGLEPGGFAFCQESGRAELRVPEFEIDAQPITWNQFVEFVEDEGYDRWELWQPAGWAWLERGRHERRGPRYVEQIGAARRGGGGGSVVQRRFGRTVRVPGNQCVVHLTWWEADAWARWAGRRLATEVEWEIAAHVAARRGFRWGDVHEWTAGTMKALPGCSPEPWSQRTPFDPQAAIGHAPILKGASFATRPRLKYLKRRAFAMPGEDGHFCGFRTCSI
ncbi:conserved hypothetical protein [Burkholderiales bacterium 8X]|nr:conserved hypothetical protein [Burkholderiales bacterium 8X]